MKFCDHSGNAVSWGPVLLRIGTVPGIARGAFGTYKQVRKYLEERLEVGNVSRQALVNVGRRYRLVLVVCPIAGLAGLIVFSVLGYPVAGTAFCAGLFMGFVNSRMVIAQAAKFTQIESPNKRALTFGVLQRLGVLTAIAFLIAFAFRPQGFTVFIGLAVFQLLMRAARLARW